MKHGFVLPVALSWLATSALAAGDDVTMQVLDDARDVDAVVRALRDARPAAGAEGDEERSNRSRAEAPAGAREGEREVRPGTHDRLTAGLDREEESEGEIEDFDIPEDLEIPEPQQE